MPNIWTHIIFGHQVLDRIGQSALIRSQPGRNLFQMGCQGPDFLFYHNFLPWKRDRRMSILGSAMHQKHCGPVLCDMVSFMRGRKLTDANVLYVLGFLLHHVLDRNMHPFVFYKSGFVKWNHQRFEVILDTIAAKKLWNLDTWKTPVWKEIETGGSFPESVVAMLEQTANVHYPELAASIKPGDWDQANRDMIAAQKLFHDPTGLKRIVTLKQIEPFVYKKTNAPLDYVNEARLPWSCPTNRDEVYDYSLWDLWDLAMEDAISVTEAAIRVWHAQDECHAEKASRHLATVIGNVSYETGKSCESGLEIRFADPVI